MKFKLFSAKIMFLLKVFLSNKIQMSILIFKVLKTIKKFSHRIIIMIILKNNTNLLSFDIIIKFNLITIIFYNIL
jgi:hypothetical protein